LALSFTMKRENTAKTVNHFQHISNTTYNCYLWLTTERLGASLIFGQF
jgi:hypothetical protein